MQQAPRLPAAGDAASKDDCSRVVVVDGGDDDRLEDDVDDDMRQRRTHAFSLCVKNEREKLLFTSQTQHITMYTVTSSSLTNHNRPHSRARFLLMYKGV